MFIETIGTHSGLYVAKCAKNECGYYGQSSPPLTLEGNIHPASCIPVLLEQIYSQLGVPGKKYPHRGKFKMSEFPPSSLTDFEREAPNEARPQHVLHVSEIERENQLQESSKYDIHI